MDIQCDLSFLEVAGGLLKTLRSRFGHLTTNGKPWFAVSVTSLPVCLYLGRKIYRW